MCIRDRHCAGCPRAVLVGGAGIVHIIVVAYAPGNCPPAVSTFQTVSYTHLDVYKRQGFPLRRDPYPVGFNQMLHRKERKMHFIEVMIFAPITGMPFLSVTCPLISTILSDCNEVLFCFWIRRIRFSEIV